MDSQNYADVKIFSQIKTSASRWPCPKSRSVIRKKPADPNNQAVETILIHIIRQPGLWKDHICEGQRNGMGLYISLHSIHCGKDHCVVRMPSAVYKMCFLVCGFILHFRSQETFLAITEKIHVFFTMLTFSGGSSLNFSILEKCSRDGWGEEI